MKTKAKWRHNAGGVFNNADSANVYSRLEKGAVLTGIKRTTALPRWTPVNTRLPLIPEHFCSLSSTAHPSLRAVDGGNENKQGSKRSP